jgi:hypothetical protein
VVSYSVCVTDTQQVAHANTLIASTAAAVADDHLIIKRAAYCAAALAHKPL